MSDPTVLCAANNEHFLIPCGTPAVATARLGDKSGPVCAEDARRALRDGWTIAWDREETR